MKNIDLNINIPLKNINLDANIPLKNIDLCYFFLDFKAKIEDNAILVILRLINGKEQIDKNYINS